MEEKKSGNKLFLKNSASLLRTIPALGTQSGKQCRLFAARVRSRPRDEKSHYWSWAGMTAIITGPRSPPIQKEFIIAEPSLSILRQITGRRFPFFETAVGNRLP